MFLCLYLGALDEEFVELHTHISSHKLASTSCVEELEKETQSAESQTDSEVENETTKWANHFCLSVLSLTLLTYSWTRIGKFSRFTYLAHQRVCSVEGPV